MKFVANFASSINLNYLQSCRKIEFVIEKSLAELARWQDHARKAFENNLREFFCECRGEPCSNGHGNAGAVESLGESVETTGGRCGAGRVSDFPAWVFYGYFFGVDVQALPATCPLLLWLGGSSANAGEPQYGSVKTQFCRRLDTAMTSQC